MCAGGQVLAHISKDLGRQDQLPSKEGFLDMQVPLPLAHSARALPTPTREPYSHQKKPTGEPYSHQKKPTGEPYSHQKKPTGEPYSHQKEAYLGRSGPDGEVVRQSEVAHKQRGLENSTSTAERLEQGTCSLALCALARAC